MGISGIGANRNAGTKKITVRDRDGSTATITIHKPTKKKTKKLQYRFKRISNQIIQAKTSGNARQVLTRAKGETVSLLRKQYTGDYDKNELRRAIVHAKQMERIAKKRMKHLQEEENVEKHGGQWQIGFDEEEMDESLADWMEGEDFSLDSEEIRKLLQEIQKELEELESENGLEELTQTVQTDMDPAELEQLKKKHRSEEMREIMEADMKYLKALFDKLESDRRESSGALGNVSVELSSVDIPIQVDNRSAAEVVSSGAAAPPAAEGGTIDVSL